MSKFLGWLRAKKARSIKIVLRRQVYLFREQDSRNTSIQLKAEKQIPPSIGMTKVIYILGMVRVE